jgi:hypothetical protein
MSDPTRDIADNRRLSERFLRFALDECHDYSPLYEHLSLRISEDDGVLAIAQNARRGQPVPNLFFGAVHLLLLRGVDHPLAAFYPSISDFPVGEDDPYRCFRSFCLDNREEIEELISRRMVQTNVVGRSACLMPAFCVVARRVGSQPLSLVEAGASAGLNLLWDLYRYDYGEGRKFGNPASPVEITSALRGDLRPDIPNKFPEVAFRLGIDLNPIDLHDDEEVFWLRALIWPEHRERVEQFRQAVELARQQQPTLVKGDILELLPEVLPQVPEGTALCIYHTATINQLSIEERGILSALVSEHARRRDIYWISMEGLGGPPPLLQLVSFEGGLITKTLLGYADYHGRWIEWRESAGVPE